MTDSKAWAEYRKFLLEDQAFVMGEKLENLEKEELKAQKHLEEVVLKYHEAQDEQARKQEAKRLFQEVAVMLFPIWFDEERINLEFDYQSYIEIEGASLTAKILESSEKFAEKEVAK